MKKRILIIDDDKTILEAIKILLEEEDFNVRILADGNNLLKKIENNIPDLILLDYRLPGKDGWEIAKEIKEWSDKFTRLTIIEKENGEYSICCYQDPQISKSGKNGIEFNCIHS